MLTSIVALGVFIAIYGIMTERKEKVALFVLSLPISTTQYTAAKVVSSLIAFLGPWALLSPLGCLVLWFDVLRRFRTG